MKPSRSPDSLRVRLTIRRSPVAWAQACKVHLRPYQVQIAHAIKGSIIHHRGLTFVVILPRQSGKNELQAHLFAWLLFRYANTGGTIVSVSPTFDPQAQINMARVRSSLNACLGTRGLWRSSGGCTFEFGNARLQFFSAEPRSNVLGATADLLLSVDEAQSISIPKFDRDFDPMTASTDATRVFWGTAGSSHTLLERERRNALCAQQEDGIQRLFYFTADDICKIVPSYARHMQRILAAHGRNHPYVRSQYYCETTDAQSGMFTPARLALIITPPPSGEGWGERSAGSPSPNPILPPQGEDLGRAGVGQSESGEAPSMWVRSAGSPSPNPQDLGRAGGLGPSPVPGLPSAPHSPLGPGVGGMPPVMGVGPSSAFLLDVAGMDECAGQFVGADFVGAGLSVHPDLNVRPGLSNPGRDSTALSIVGIDLSSLEALGHPTYHVVARHSWVGENHLSVFGKIKSLAETWHPQNIVIDATGVGEGLWALLDRAFPARVIPVKFTRREKSEIGWRFLSIIETGRFRDHVHTDQVHLQYTRCVSEVLPGPLASLRWGVPEGARGPDGELIHDDFVLADALVARLDQLEWSLSTTPLIVPGRDPLLDMDQHVDHEYDHYFGDHDYDHFFGEHENVHYSY